MIKLKRDLFLFIYSKFYLTDLSLLGGCKNLDSYFCGTMASISNSCRLCLKLTIEKNLTPLFEIYGSEENVALEWRRMFSFIYNIQGLPDKICNNCKAQTEWILNFHRQCYENDIVLRLNQQRNLHSGISEYDTETRNAEFFGNGEIDCGANEELVSVVKTNENPEIIDYEHEQNPIIEDTEMVEQEHFDEYSVDHHIQSEKGSYEEDKSKEQLDIMDSSNRDVSYMESDYSEGTGISAKRSNIKMSSYYCPICEKSFTFKCNMEQHRKRHDNPKPFECSFPGCDKKFASKRMKDGHIKSIHEGYVYKCPICTHTERYKVHVAKHIRKIHVGIGGLQPIEYPKTG